MLILGSIAVTTGVAFFSPAMRFSRSTSPWFFSNASGVKRGSIFRKSPSPSLVSLFIAPVKEALTERAVGHETDA